MSPHPLFNFEIQKYYQNELRYNGIYSRNCSHNNKDRGICNKPRRVQISRNSLNGFLYQW